MFKRIEKFEEIILSTNISAVYISSPKTIFYLFGLNISNGYFIFSKKRKIFITDGRYIQVTKDVFCNSNIEVVNIKNIKSVVSIFEQENLKKVGIEFDKITVKEFNKLQKINSKIEYKSIDNFIEKMRIIKDEKEIEIIKTGVKYHEDIYSYIISKIKEGTTELEVKKLFDCNSLDVTSLGTSFETIVAFGENSALPHHHSTNKKLKKGDTILIDSGINYKGYSTDMTRTIFFDSINEKLEKTYKQVYNAVEIGEKSVVINDFTSTPHKRVVEYFKKQKVEKNYLHSLGHGVGLDIHEAPSLGIKDTEKFEVGAVFTIEPGLYYENIGGIRLENMYFISNQGVNKFNELDYKLKVI